MKELLAISWAMPPLLFPRSIQVARTMKALHHLGWQPTVVTADPASIASPADYDLDLEAHYRPCYHLESVPSLERSLLLRILWRFAPGLRFLPDDKRIWVRPAVAAASRLLKLTPFPVLITFAQPWSDHLIGLQLHRSQGMPWVAHFSDPWVDSPYLQAGEALQKRWRTMEENILREADAVVFVTRQTADLVMQKYPSAWKNKVHVVPHGYDPDLLPQGGIPSENPMLKLVYTGGFYGRRTPVGLLQALAALNQSEPLAGRLELRLFGKIAQEFQQMVLELGLAGIVECAGSVTVKESLQKAAAADVLVLIDAPNDRESVFLPSKLVDYLALRKPILGLTPLQGASADLLRRVQCPLAAPDDVGAIQGCIQDLLFRKQNGSLQPGAGFDQVVQEYDIHNTTRKLDEILKRVAAIPG